MKLITIKRKRDHGNPYIEGHRYEDTLELEVGLNRIKLNYTQNPDKEGLFVTWYPFSFYWWPPNNQWFRWRILGIKIRRNAGSDWSMIR